MRPIVGCCLDTWLSCWQSHCDGNSNMQTAAKCTQLLLSLPLSVIVSSPLPPLCSLFPSALRPVSHHITPTSSSALGHVLGTFACQWSASECVHIWRNILNFWSKCMHFTGEIGEKRLSHDEVWLIDHSTAQRLGQNHLLQLLCHINHI